MRHLLPHQAIWRAYSMMFRFSGRSGRTEFVWFAIFFFAVMFGMRWMGAVFAEAGILYRYDKLLLVVVMLPLPAMLIRRVHDLNWSGWVALVSAIPLIGGLFTIYLMFQKSDVTPNRFDGAGRENRLRGAIGRVF